MTHALIRAVRAGLAAQADPARARGMQRYMKSAMPYYGIPAPLQRRVWRDIFAEHPLASCEEVRSVALTLWRAAAYREERYAAIALTDFRRYACCQTRAAVPMYEEMIVTGAWWDYVDSIAAHRLGGLLRLFPKPMKREMLAWSRSDDLWKRRSAILCQLRFKQETDLGLLYATIKPALSSREFFLRKAIGWALRQYAWTNPKEVARYVRAHTAELSPLSKREALKNVGKKSRR
jgi:3-methyladenine DNA glycosylase AlkD